MEILKLIVCTIILLAFVATIMYVAVATITITACIWLYD